jgi:glycerophosphoryl diester phosphodiesterase
MSKIIGHRGSCGEFPENTVLGIKEAIKNDVDGVEIDVRLTKDNQL